MKSITIKGSTRKVLGKSTKELRNQEMALVLYGEGEPVHFSEKN